MDVSAGTSGLMSGTLPEGTALHVLNPHHDHRGSLTELFRKEWGAGLDFVQWNYIQSAAKTLRGVHVHIRHTDYLVVLSGAATIGLRDLRPQSPTEGAVAMVRLAGEGPAGLLIPAGVAHGFMFQKPSSLIFAVSHYWDLTDELGCHWNDPALEMTWPADQAVLSDRDSALPPLSALLSRIPPWQAS